MRRGPAAPFPPPAALARSVSPRLAGGSEPGAGTEPPSSPANARWDASAWQIHRSRQVEQFQDGHGVPVPKGHPHVPRFC